jgi:hypothetical protein
MAFLAKLGAPWRRSCLTVSRIIDHGRPMLQAVYRFVDVSVVVLILSAFT